MFFSWQFNMLRLVLSLKVIAMMTYGQSFFHPSHRVDVRLCVQCDFNSLTTDSEKFQLCDTLFSIESRLQSPFEFHFTSKTLWSKVDALHLLSLSLTRYQTMLRHTTSFHRATSYETNTFRNTFPTEILASPNSLKKFKICGGLCMFVN